MQNSTKLLFSAGCISDVTILLSYFSASQYIALFISSHVVLSCALRAILPELDFGTPDCILLYETAIVYFIFLFEGAATRNARQTSILFVIRSEIFNFQFI